MNSKPAVSTSSQTARRMEQKLQERSAVLYLRELERWNTRPLGR